MVYCQGDVCLEPIPTLPDGAALCSRRNDNRVVLAYGEVTGHAHAFREDYVEPYEAGGVAYVIIHAEPVTLFHEEHAPIRVPPGIYRVRRQSEYAPKRIRLVTD